MNESERQQVINELRRNIEALKAELDNLEKRVVDGNHELFVIKSYADGLARFASRLESELPFILP